MVGETAMDLMLMWFLSEAMLLVAAISTFQSSRHLRASGYVIAFFFFLFVASTLRLRAESKHIDHVRTTTDATWANSTGRINV